MSCGGGEACVAQREQVPRGACRAEVIGAVRDIEQDRTTSPRLDTVSRLGAALRLSGRELEDLASLAAAGRDAAGRGRLPGLAVTGDGLRLAVLGPIAASRDGFALSLGPVRQRAVLGLLALYHGTGLSRAAIIDTLWGEDPPQSAVGILQGHVSRLRQTIGPAGAPAGRDSGLCWDGSGYRLMTSGVSCDLADFANSPTAPGRLPWRAMP